MNRVKFYSCPDMANTYQLDLLETRMNQFKPDLNDYRIYEIIEFYNMIRFIDAECYLKRWSQEYIEKLHTTVPIFRKKVAVYMQSLVETEFIELFKELEYDYYNDLWELIDKYKVYQKISHEAMRTVLMNYSYQLHFFLTNKNLVKYYAEVTREILLSEEKNAELLLDEFAVHHEVGKTKYFFPECLTQKDRESLIMGYTQWQDANLNYLRIIANTLSRPGLVLSDKTRLAAQKRTNFESKKFFEGNAGFKYGVSVSLSEELDEDFKVEYKDGMIDGVYNKSWFNDNLDYYTLLNNFVHVFGFADLRMRITLVSKPTYLSLMERYIFMRPKNSYPTSISFEQLNNLSVLQIIMYSQYLKQKDTRLETVIEWFFSTYLREEFHIDDYRVRMPSEEASYLEKCRAILPEIETVLKQYQLYVEDDKIDHELLQISSEHLFFRNAKSKIDSKYIYPVGGEYQEITYYLFSDQSGLAYIDLTKNKHSILFSLLRDESVTLDDFQLYQQHRLKRMLELGYLLIDAENKIRFKDQRVVLLLRDLYNNEVISYWHYPAEFRNIIDELVIRGLVKAESSLFSKPEQAYFNYHLNKAEFCNSLDLRNKYIHGTQPSDESSEQTHETNYHIFLKLLVLIIIKINDDLCLYDDICEDKHTGELKE